MTIHENSFYIKSDSFIPSYIIDYYCFCFKTALSKSSAVSILNTLCSICLLFSLFLHLIHLLSLLYLLSFLHLLFFAILLYMRSCFGTLFVLGVSLCSICSRYSLCSSLYGHNFFYLIHLLHLLYLLLLFNFHSFSYSLFCSFSPSFSSCLLFYLLRPPHNFLLSLSLSLTRFFPLSKRSLKAS